MYSALYQLWGSVQKTPVWHDQPELNVFWWMDDTVWFHAQNTNVYISHDENVALKSITGKMCEVSVDV